MGRFRMLPPAVDDFDKTVTRIEKTHMTEMGLHDGDTVKITGMRSSGALCYAMEDGFRLQSDSDITYLSENPTILPTMRGSNLVVNNINHHGTGLIPVTVEKVCDGARPASKVCLMSLGPSLHGEDFVKDKLDTMIVCRNDRLRFQDEKPQNNFGLYITSVEPSDCSQITKDTLIEFVKTDPDKLSSVYSGVKLEKLLNVIPVVYQETLSNVDVTIPSFEIFDTGIRFFIYTKSSFGQNQTIENGPTSVVVTLEDDLGNLYELTSHGGGGSSSQRGFEYKHEFHGRPVHPDATHLTVTLHEILIQERFPREDPSRSVARKPIRGTKFEYAKIDKFPSFLIISGPWKTSFQLDKGND